MSKRSIRGESSSIIAHKRHGTAPQDEGPLPSESSSLGQVSSSSIPKIPIDLISDLILPFIADRATWNSLHCANKELCLAGKKMTPPWPNKAFNFKHAVRHVAFSPSGSHLAFGVYTVQPNDGAYQCVIHVWDVWGRETLLAGHTGYIYCLEYSLDGAYLASGCQDGSIRLWHTESFNATSSNTPNEKSTQTPQQAGTILLGRSDYCLTLSFSRTDSNLLAGGSHFEIKLWNVKEQACIYSFYPGRGVIRSLFFAGGSDNTCIAVKHPGSVIRLWRAEGSSEFASETIGKGAADGGGNYGPQTVLSRCGSFLATLKASMTENTSTLALYELETMTKTQSVVISDFSAASCFVVSPDSKQLVLGDTRGRFRLVQIDDFSIQKDLKARGGSSSLAVFSLAFDPTSRVLAFGCRDGRLELRTL
jgi:WD40 repeat protein